MNALVGSWRTEWRALNRDQHTGTMTNTRSKAGAKDLLKELRIKTSFSFIQTAILILRTNKQADRQTDRRMEWQEDRKPENTKNVYSWLFLQMVLSVQTHTSKLDYIFILRLSKQISTNINSDINRITCYRLSRKRSSNKTWENKNKIKDIY